MRTKALGVSARALAGAGYAVAIHAHRSLAAATYAYMSEVDPVAPGDPILHAAPMSHGSGLYMMAHVARMGINVQLEEASVTGEEHTDRRVWIDAGPSIRRECRRAEAPHAILNLMPWEEGLIP